MHDSSTTIRVHSSDIKKKNNKASNIKFTTWVIFKVVALSRTVLRNIPLTKVYCLICPLVSSQFFQKNRTSTPPKPKL